MGQGHSGTGTGFEWDLGVMGLAVRLRGLELGHSGTSSDTQWDWDIIGLVVVLNGIWTQWDW